MARPTNKKDLIELAEINYQKLWSLIDKLNEQKRLEDFKGASLNRNIRDVLYHLHIWHKMTLEWNKASKDNLKPSIPAEGYTWRTLPDLNKKIQKDGMAFSLREAQDLFANSHLEILKTIRDYSDESLFQKKVFKWTGSTSAGAYFVSSTSSHYDWTLKFLKRKLKD